MPRIPISPYLIIQKTFKKGEHALLLERDKNITDTLPFFHEPLQDALPYHFITKMVVSHGHAVYSQRVKAD